MAEEVQGVEVTEGEQGVGVEAIEEVEEIEKVILLQRLINFLTYV